MKEEPNEIQATSHFIIEIPEIHPDWNIELPVSFTPRLGIDLTLSPEENQRIYTEKMMNQIPELSKFAKLKQWFGL